MQINWKVRCKSGAFWMAVVAALLMFLSALLGLMGLQLPVAMEEIMQVSQLFLTLLATIGIITDPTTPGMADSKRALGYSVPGGTNQERDPPA